MSQCFEFKLTDEFIPLVSLLKITGLFSTGGQAKIAIEQGEILVDGEAEYRKRRKIRQGMMIQHGDSSIRVL